MKTINGFSKLSKSEKINWLAENFSASPDDFTAVLSSWQHEDDSVQRTVDGFTENAISNYVLPYSIAPNFVINGRPYASLICAGSDGHNAARQIERIATGWRLKPVAEPLIVCTHAQTPEAILAPKHIGEDELMACRALGEAMAAGLALGVF